MLDRGPRPDRDRARRRGRSTAKLADDRAPPRSSPRCGASRDGDAWRRRAQPTAASTLRAEDRQGRGGDRLERAAASIDRQVRAFDPAPGARRVARRQPRQALAGAAPGRSARPRPRRGRSSARRVRRRRRLRRGRAAHRRAAAGGRPADGGGRVRRRASASRRRRSRASTARRGLTGGAMRAGAQRQAALAVRRVLRRRRRLPPRSRRRAVGRRAPPGRRRALVQELAYGTLRHWGTLDALTRALAAKPLTDPLLRCLVAVALYQLDHTRAPPFAVVDHAVDNAAAMVRPAAKALVNALLRRYLREREALDAARPRGSRRALVVSALVDRSRCARISATTGRRSSTRATSGRRSRCASTVRVTTRDALLARVRASRSRRDARRRCGHHRRSRRARSRSCRASPRARSRCRISGAQLAAPLLRPQSGMRVLDACAAPGGKTTHLAELADVELVALDSDAARLARVRENLARLPHRRRATSTCARRCRRAVDVVGRPAVRPDPRRRALHRVGRGAPASGRQVAAAGVRSRRLRAAAGAPPRGAVALPRARRAHALRDVLGLSRRKRGAGRAPSWRRTPTRCAKPSPLRPDVAARGGQLLPSLPGASHNQDGFFYALLRKG